MKRTKNINQETFRKSWRSYRVAPVALAISAVFMLAGCEKSDETVSLYQNADDCSRANPSMSEQCTTSYNNALQEAAKTAPKYATREDCVAEFGEAQCTQAPAQAGMAAESQSSGSFWMPLMAGYMMGRLMGGSGFAQQPGIPCSEGCCRSETVSPKCCSASALNAASASSACAPSAIRRTVSP